MQELGLKKIDPANITPGEGASSFARAYDQLNTHVNKDTDNIYYTYGWSALLSKKLWKQEADRFYHTLCKEIETYRKQGLEPKIRIIGYSHGGTMAANLALTQKKPGHKAPITIDELILIGMPVAQEVAECLKNPLFKKIYHIYSYGDRVQSFDIFSLNALPFKRTFTHCAKNPLNNKLHQIGLKMYRLSTVCQKKCPNGHPTYPSPPRHVRNVHPGHTELWSFGWVDSSYRNYLPIAPLPLATCIPWFTSLADTYSESSHNITIEMHPYCNHTNIYCYESGITKQQPFITASVLEEMQKDAACFCPPGSHSKEYERHIQTALRAAHKTTKVKKVDYTRMSSQIRNKSSIESCCARKANISSSS